MPQNDKLMVIGTKIAVTELKQSRLYTTWDIVAFDGTVSSRLYTAVVVFPPIARTRDELVFIRSKTEKYFKCRVKIGGQFMVV